jgi:hypothetical protein
MAWPSLVHKASPTCEDTEGSRGLVVVTYTYILIQLFGLFMI